MRFSNIGVGVHGHDRPSVRAASPHLAAEIAGRSFEPARGSPRRRARVTMRRVSSARLANTSLTRLSIPGVSLDGVSVGQCRPVALVGQRRRRPCAPHQDAVGMAVP